MLHGDENRIHAHKTPAMKLALHALRFSETKAWIFHKLLCGESNANVCTAFFIYAKDIHILHGMLHVTTIRIATNARIQPLFARQRNDCGGGIISIKYGLTSWSNFSTDNDLVNLSIPHLIEAVVAGLDELGSVGEFSCIPLRQKWHIPLFKSSQLPPTLYQIPVNTILACSYYCWSRLIRRTSKLRVGSLARSQARSPDTTRKPSSGHNTFVLPTRLPPPLPPWTRIRFRHKIFAFVDQFKSWLSDKHWINHSQPEQSAGQSSR